MPAPVTPTTLLDRYRRAVQDCYGAAILAQSIIAYDPATQWFTVRIGEEGATLHTQACDILMTGICYMRGRLPYREGDMVHGYGHAEAIFACVEHHD